MSVNVAVVGLGYWGPNLVRNFANVPGARLHTLVDARPERLTALSRQFPAARTTTDVDDMLRDPEVHAVVVATQVASHFDITSRALAAGKHVMVEKPLAGSARECEELVRLADAHNRLLMAAHVFIYNPAVRKVKACIDEGLIGDVLYVYSQRLNLGIVRKDVNALWNFAPHDLSIINYWLGGPPSGVVARGFSYLQPDIEDVVFMTLDYPRGVGANVHISWLDPHKIRRMTVVGSKKMIVYDDVNPEARVTIYDKGVRRSLGDFESYGEFQLLMHAGDVLIPRVDNAEPLQLECRHFIECIATGAPCMTDGRHGLEVVRTLEAAQSSMKAHGAPVAMSTVA